MVYLTVGCKGLSLRVLRVPTVDSGPPKIGGDTPYYHSGNQMLVALFESGDTLKLRGSPKGFAPKPVSRKGSVARLIASGMGKTRTM